MPPTTVEDLGGLGLPALLQLLKIVPMMTGEGVDSPPGLFHRCGVQGSAGTLLVGCLEL